MTSRRYTPKRAASKFPNILPREICLSVPSIRSRRKSISFPTRYQRPATNMRNSRSPQSIPAGHGKTSRSISARRSAGVFNPAQSKSAVDIQIVFTCTGGWERCAIRSNATAIDSCAGGRCASLIRDKSILNGNGSRNSSRDHSTSPAVPQERVSQN